MKIIILDRDGVINEDSDDYIKNAEEWLPIEGSIEAIAKLSKAGYTIVVATNQSGLGRGLFSLRQLEEMHEKMQLLVKQAGGKIGAIFFCPHLPTDLCSCRKPNTGMLEAVEKSFQCSVEGSVFIGDSFKDLEAGIAKGCQPVLVLTGKGEKTKEQLEKKQPIWSKQVLTYESLAAVAIYLLQQEAAQ